MRIRDLRRPLIELRSLKSTNPLRYRWTEWSPVGYNMIAEFKSGNLKYHVTFSITEDSDPMSRQKAYSVAFFTILGKVKKDKTVSYSDVLTGSGNSISVLMTVATIINEFIRRADPIGLKFSAIGNEPSRIKLYDRIAPQLATKYGFKYTRGTRNGDAIYILTKRKKRAKR